MNWNKYIHPDDLKKISEQIKAVESKSSAEIITVIANKSSTTRHVKLIIFLLLSVFTLLAFHFFTNLDFNEDKALYIIAIHLVCFIASFLLSQWGFLQRLFIPVSYTHLTLPTKRIV